MEHRIDPHSGLRLRPLAALLSIAIGVALVACAIAAAAPRHLSPADANGGPRGAAAEEVEEEVEWEWGEEEVEWEFEEGEEEVEVELEFEEEASRAREGAGPPAGCALQGTSARVVASDTSDTLRLSLRYASRESVRVAIHYSMEGAGGAAHLVPSTLHATRHGRLDYTEHPGAHRMSKLRDAHTLVVSIETPGAPDSCRHYSTKRLTSRRHGHAHIVWSETPQHPGARR
jgi:hypothetical protein